MADDMHYLRAVDAEWERIALGAGTLRRTRRLGERLRVGVPVRSTTARERLNGVVVDLSCTGCALSNRHNVGTTSVLCFDLGARSFIIAARCVRWFDGGAAYEFACFPDSDRLTLAETLDAFRRSRPG